MKFLDVKSFKKVHDDGKTATMRHDKGHEITVMIKKLSPLQQEQLKRLPLHDGGDVKGVHRGGDSKGRSFAGSYNEEAKKDKPEYRKQHAENAKQEHRDVLAESRAMPKPKLQNLDRGGAAGYQLNGDPTNKLEYPGGELKYTSQEDGQEPVQHYSSGTPDAPVEKDQQYDSSGYPIKNTTPQPITASGVASVFKPNYKGGIQHFDQGAAPVKQTPTEDFVGSDIGSADNAPIANVQDAAPNPQLPNGSMSAGDTAKLGTQAAKEKEQNDIAAAQAQIPSTAQLQKAQAEQAQRDQAHINELSGHADDYANHLAANPEDANRVIKTMGTGEKLATAFGLIAGGFANGLSGGKISDTAYDWLNNQIDRDVAAQRQNKQDQHNIYSAYEHLYQNQNIASRMTKASLMDVYATGLKKIALQQGTPQAIAAYHDVLSKMVPERNKAILDSAGNFNQLPYNNRNAQAPGPGIAPPQEEPTSQPTPEGAQGQPAGPSQGPYNDAINKTGGNNTEFDIPDKELDTWHKHAKASTQPFLSRNSSYFMNAVKLDPTISPEQKAKISEQHTNADQADKLLMGTPENGYKDSLPDTMYNMAKLAKQGGYAGRAYRTVDPDAIPGGENFVTGGVKAVAGLAHGALNSANVRQYNSYQTKLIQDLHAAGIPIEEAGKMVRRNSPEYGDMVPDIEQHTKALDSEIRSAVHTDALKGHPGFLHRQK